MEAPTEDISIPSVSENARKNLNALLRAMFIVIKECIQQSEERLKCF